MSRLMPRKVFTLVIIKNESSILLGYKKRGFGQGKWNGFGGKVRDTESVQDAAVREAKEECGLDLKNLLRAGTLEFEFMGKPGILNVHVFKSTSFEGEVTESEEMLPKWFSIDDIPFSHMWPDDKDWLPLLLSGSKFYGYYLYDCEERIIQKRLKITDNMM